MEPIEEYELRLQLARNWEINAPGKSFSDFESQLAARINQLVIEDFNKLISILYRLDIDEYALRNLLQDAKSYFTGSSGSNVFRLFVNSIAAVQSV